MAGAAVLRCRALMILFSIAGALAGGRGAVADEHPANSPAALSAGEVKIRQALASPTRLEFIETPLADVVEYLKQVHDIPIEISAAALNDVGLSTDVPITRNLHGLTLRTALRLILRDLELTYMIDGEVLTITTPEEAQRHASTRVYDVSALLPLSADDASELAELVQQMIPPPPSPPHDPSQPPQPRRQQPRAVASYHFLLVVRAAEETHYEVEQLLAGLEAGLTEAARATLPRMSPPPAAPQPKSPATRTRETKKPAIKGPPSDDPFGADPFGAGDAARDPFDPGDAARDPFGAGDAARDPFGVPPKKP